MNEQSFFFSFACLLVRSSTIVPEFYQLLGYEDFGAIIFKGKNIIWMTSSDIPRDFLSLEFKLQRINFITKSHFIAINVSFFRITRDSISCIVYLTFSFFFFLIPCLCGCSCFLFTFLLLLLSNIRGLLFCFSIPLAITCSPRISYKPRKL